MSDESFIEFTIDRISARDQIGSDLPEQLTRKRPTPIAVSFPHDDGLEALAPLARPEIMMGSLTQQYTSSGRSGVIVSLLYTGLLRRISSRSWQIIHPAFYGVSVTVPSAADLFVFGKNPPPDIALNYLKSLLMIQPPSSLLS